MDTRVLDTVERCLAGGMIDVDEAIAFMGYDSLSAEAAHIRWAAETIGRIAAGGIGQIYAQIGVDAGPCPLGCAFCSLAAANRRPGMPAGEVPLERIVGYAQAFDRAGVHLITLMSTGAMRFARYLEIVRAVRAAVSDDMPLMANTADFSREQAAQLKEAGVQAVYHADRLGEGAITGISPERREATIDAVRSVGLAFMSAVEPVQQSDRSEDIAQAMARVIAQRPYCAGVGALTAIPHGRDELAPISRARGHFLAAIMRLMAGTSIPNGTGSGNVLWVDAGTNPRARDLPVDEAALRRDVARQRKALIGQEWIVPDRPLPGWFAF